MIEKNTDLKNGDKKFIDSVLCYKWQTRKPVKCFYKYDVNVAAKEDENNFYLYKKQCIEEVPKHHINGL